MANRHIRSGLAGKVLGREGRLPSPSGKACERSERCSARASTPVECANNRSHHLRDRVVGLVVANAAVCSAVIDAEPASGAGGTRLLQTLASYRLRDGAIDFGMYAEVSAPGRVFRDDPVTVIPAGTPA